MASSAEMRCCGSYVSSLLRRSIPWADVYLNVCLRFEYLRDGSRSQL